jgi:hypothetical protein
MLEANVNESYPNSRVPTKAKIRIAIADDHPIFRDGLCRLLSLEKDFDVVAQVEDGLHPGDGEGIFAEWDGRAAGGAWASYSCGGAGASRSSRR